MPEACDLRSAHVAPDHPVGQARLECLINNAAAPPEIRLAASDEVVERHVLGSATALRLQYAHCRVRIRQGLHLPDALTSVPAVLLEDAWAGCAQARREFSTEASCTVVAMGVRAPSQMARL